MKLKSLILGIMLSFSIFSSALILIPATAQAATQENCTKNSSTFLGFPTWYKYLDPTFDSVTNTCNLDFDITKDIGKVLLAVFEIVLRVAGLVAVGFVIYGGFQYLISQGEPEQLKGARSTILNAVIGLAIAVSATAIVNLIARNIV